jgi:hypothetical protein
MEGSAKEKSGDPAHAAATATPEEVEDEIARLAMRRGLMRPAPIAVFVDMLVSRARRKLLNDGLD